MRIILYSFHFIFILFYKKLYRIINKKQYKNVRKFIEKR